ncbi:FAD synthetase 2, chloroplastic-like isoform X1 [Cucurbita moschata]|uniref:FAD synthetase 2, chloroplastic-like isoform X1 n=1 Tax=Cucurbita moschata TaxID=3662 RepID=A0A6J1G0H2_CUCMO|nr:FAD synthetase 2, chloroplastic-like isoform X1 [Cucurbita moschata]
MLAAGARVSHHLRECDCHFGFRLNSGLPSSSSSAVVPFPPIWPRKPTSSPSISHRSQRRGYSFFCSIVPSFAAGEPPILSDCFGYRGGGRVVSVTGGIVALGKFDALHVGHRELAIQASKLGSPFLLSFVGIAQVLGWEPRAPVVAQCDRTRVLSSWAPFCRNMAPSEYQIQFSSVRHLTPREFVVKLSNELGVRGVVAGESYRFGYKAAGDTAEYGVGAYIIKSVMDKNQEFTDSTNSKEQGQVLSTRVRYTLSTGDMKYVSELLGCRHRLVLMAKDVEGLSYSNSRVSVPRSCSLNLAPKEGLYDKCFVWSFDQNLTPCRVVIDSSHVHIELDELATCRHPVGTDDYISVEFDDEGV